MREQILHKEMSEDAAYDLGVTAGRAATEKTHDAARASAYRFRDSIQLLPRSQWHKLTQRFLVGWQDGARVRLAENIPGKEDDEDAPRLYAMPYRTGVVRRLLRWLIGS